MRTTLHEGAKLPTVIDHREGTAGKRAMDGSAVPFRSFLLMCRLGYNRDTFSQTKTSGRNK